MSRIHQEASGVDFSPSQKMDMKSALGLDLTLGGVCSAESAFGVQLLEASSPRSGSTNQYNRTLTLEYSFGIFSLGMKSMLLTS